MSTHAPAASVAMPSHRRLDAAVAVWLVVSLIGTVVGWLAQWPAQFGGSGTVGQVGSELLGKGTVLSPPLFMVMLMLVAVGLARVGSRTVRWAGQVLAGLVGAVGVVGSLGEVLAAATPDLPRVTQWLGLVGVVLSLAVVIAVVYDLIRG